MILQMVNTYEAAHMKEVTSTDESNVVASVEAVPERTDHEHR